jgi:hypothetical protein
MPNGTKPDSVERQLTAYNARDLDGFVTCYAEAVVIEDADGAVRTSGREAMRTRYRPVFAGFPELHADVVTRIRVGSYVVDEERVTGGPGGPVHAIAIYRLDDAGAIDRVRFLR